MPKKAAPKLRPDAAGVAIRGMQQAVGDAPKTDHAQKSAKNAEAAKRGKKGGKARAMILPAAARSKAAKKAAQQRWQPVDAE